MAKSSGGGSGRTGGGSESMEDYNALGNRIETARYLYESAENASYYDPRAIITLRAEYLRLIEERERLFPRITAERVAERARQEAVNKVNYWNL